MLEKLTRQIWMIIFLLVCCLISLVLVSVLGADSVKEGQKPIRSEDVIVDVAKNITVGKPVSYQNLTIFPLVLSKVIDVKDYVSLDEAIKKGYLEIQEFNGGTVPEVRVINKSYKEIFLMAGEIITGCRQDRILAGDVLIGAKADIVVPVYCVEQGRWTEESRKFDSKQSNAPAELRQGAYKKNPQGWIWSKVAEKQANCEIKSSTGKLQQVYEDKKVQEESKKYIACFEKLPQLDKNVTGVAVAIGDRVICVDMFCNPKLFSKLYAKLLKSYVLDAINPIEKGYKVTRDDIKDFIKELIYSKYREEKTPGLGTKYVIENRVISGAALVLDRAVIHLAIFPEVESKR